MWGNKRRYGGYVVHVGMVLIFIGIAGSSAYQKEAIEVMKPGDSIEVDGYTMRYDGYRFEAVDDHIGAVTEMSVFLNGDHLANLEAEQRFHPNMVFPELSAAFVRAKSLHDGDPVEYHNAVVGLYGLIQQIEARARREVKTPSTEVAIHSSFDLRHPTRFGEDFYVIPLWVDPASGEANIRVFVNPMVNFIWLGGLVVVFGAHLAVLPDARERRRLRAALAMEEKAVA
jgi:cytochrome c-type biogenesis protein CcmF